MYSFTRKRRSPNKGSSFLIRKKNKDYNEKKSLAQFGRAHVNS